MDALDKALIKAVNDIGPAFLDLLSVCAYCGASLMCGVFLWQLYLWSKGSPNAWQAPAIFGVLILSGLAFNIGTLLQAFGETMFGRTGSEVTFPGLSYSAEISQQAQEHLNASLRAIMQLIQLIGYYAFFRGPLVLYSVTRGRSQASWTAGACHMIAGTALVHIGDSIRVIQATVNLTLFN